jgi:hypothetical protein
MQKLKAKMEREKMTRTTLKVLGKMVLQKEKVRNRRRMVKLKRVTHNGTREPGRVQRVRGRRGTRRKPIALIFFNQMAVPKGVSVLLGMIGWILQVGGASGVGRKNIAHWSAQGQNGIRERQAVQGERAKEKLLSI